MNKEDFEKEYCSICKLGCSFKGCYEFRYIPEGPQVFRIPEERPETSTHLTEDYFSKLVTHYPIILIMFALVSKKEDWFAEMKTPADLLPRLYELYKTFKFDFRLLERALREAWWVGTDQMSLTFKNFVTKKHQPLVVLSTN